MLKYLIIYEEAVNHIWLCNWSILNFLIYEESLIFFFISALRRLALLLCSWAYFLSLSFKSYFTVKALPDMAQAVTFIWHDCYKFLRKRNFHTFTNASVQIVHSWEKRLNTFLSVYCAYTVVQFSQLFKIIYWPIIYRKITHHYTYIYCRSLFDKEELVSPLKLWLDLEVLNRVSYIAWGG